MDNLQVPFSHFLYRHLIYIHTLIFIINFFTLVGSKLFLKKSIKMKDTFFTSLYFYVFFRLILNLLYTYFSFFSTRNFHTCNFIQRHFCKNGAFNLQRRKKLFRSILGIFFDEIFLLSF